MKGCECMKLAISGETLGYTDCLDIICETLATQDVHYIELWPVNCFPEKGKEIYPYLYRNRDLEKTKSVLDKYGIQVCAVSFGAAFDRSVVNNPDLYADEFAKAVDVAEFFGAKIVNHYCRLISTSDEMDYEILERYYRKALEQAEKKKIVLTLENEAHDMVRTPLKMKMAIEHFNSQYFKTNYDATNYLQSSCEAFPAAYNILKEHIGYVHLSNGCKYDPEYFQRSDWLGGTMTGAFSPGNIVFTYIDQGAVNVLGILKTLYRNKYTGFCTLEPHTNRTNTLMYYPDLFSELKLLRSLDLWE